MADAGRPEAGRQAWRGVWRWPDGMVEALRRAVATTRHIPCGDAVVVVVHRHPRSCDEGYMGAVAGVVKVKPDNMSQQPLTWSCTVRILPFVAAVPDEESDGAGQEIDRAQAGKSVGGVDNAAVRRYASPALVKRGAGLAPRGRSFTTKGCEARGRRRTTGLSTQAGFVRRPRGRCRRLSEWVL